MRARGAPLALPPRGAATAHRAALLVARQATPKNRPRRRMNRGGLNCGLNPTKCNKNPRSPVGYRFPHSENL